MARSRFSRKGSTRRSRKRRPSKHSRRGRDVRRSRKSTGRSKSRRQNKSLRRSRKHRTAKSRSPHCVSDRKITGSFTKHDLEPVLSARHILSNTRPNELKKYPVRLSETPGIGVGLVANRDIRKGEILAYYRMRVVPYATYRSPTNNMYAFTAYTKGDNPSGSFMGDIAPESLPPAENNIPYWAYFSNEPSRLTGENAEIDVDTKYNYKDHCRTSLKAGDHIRYRLIATKNIKKGTPVTWCYGNDYERNYSTECSRA